MSRIEAAYKRYPDLELNDLAPEETARMLEMGVMMNTTYTESSFVHKMMLQAAHSIRQLMAAQPCNRCKICGGLVNLKNAEKPSA